jgi:hypothetical protein
MVERKPAPLSKLYWFRMVDGFQVYQQINFGVTSDLLMALECYLSEFPVRVE